MNEKERKSFGIAFSFYEKWRAQIIEKEEQWQEFSEDTGRLAADLDTDHNPLGQHLFYAVLDTFSDLYRNGMKPMPANYFGRDDL